MTGTLTSEEQRVARQAAARIHAQSWGVAFGLLFGLGLFVATNVLVLRGGEEVGPHLGLLSVYFPGYRVSFLGSLLGFVYMFVGGYAIGRIMVMIYYWVVRVVE
jgi:hypothetical protein